MEDIEFVCWNECDIHTGDIGESAWLIRAQIWQVANFAILGNLLPTAI